MFWQRGTKEKETEKEETVPVKPLIARQTSTKKQTGLRTVKGYKSPEDLETKVQKTVQQICGNTGENWRSFTLADRRVKFKILSKLMTDLDHNIGNAELSAMKTIEDVLTYFKTTVRDTSVYEDLTKLDLPKNLHISMHSLKYDPEKDTLFGGKTAFPDHKTVTHSLKQKHRSNSVD